VICKSPTPKERNDKPQNDRSTNLVTVIPLHHMILGFPRAQGNKKRKLLLLFPWKLFFQSGIRTICKKISLLLYNVGFKHRCQGKGTVPDNLPANSTFWRTLMEYIEYSIIIGTPVRFK